MEASTLVSACLQLGQLQLFHRHLTTPGLAIPLRFPPAVAVGFRGADLLEGSFIREPVRYVLETADVQPITPEHILHEELRSGDGEISPIRYEEPKGSLEIIDL